MNKHLVVILLITVFSTNHTYAIRLFGPHGADGVQLETVTTARKTKRGLWPLLYFYISSDLRTLPSLFQHLCSIGEV